ncbi:hypothetical protein CDAR_606141 [Caerostris darwini]|uniref:Uncharacterized protein n=1 Tax=Caerostris darwini TaxID=1538125 RepID=A0AAV4NPR7_9ARAC|nr:hypothetical protein CDAR_606141 [Caerostris darwini]
MKTLSAGGGRDCFVPISGAHNRQQSLQPPNQFGCQSALLKRIRDKGRGGVVAIHSEIRKGEVNLFGDGRGIYRNEGSAIVEDDSSA